MDQNTYNDVNNCFKYFLSKCHNFVNISSTIKVMNSNNNNIKEWMTADLFRSVKIKKKKLSLKAKKKIK